MNVLWENTSAAGPDGWHLSGLTDNYLRINTITMDNLWNKITPVRITGLTEQGLQGEMIDA